MRQLSVIIPVFNRSWQLARALDSLVIQTDRDFEVVICDDGSTEDIHAVVQPYLHQLQLRYIRIDNSGGPARPRNTAVSHASGEWLSFLDSDDWWDADRIAVIKSSLNEDSDLIYHRLRVVCAPGLIKPREKRRIIGEDLRCDPLSHMFLYGNPIPNSAALIRSSWLKKIGGLSEDRELVSLEDFDAWLRVVESGGRIKFLERTLGSYWVGEDAISGISKSQAIKQKILFERHRKLIPEDVREHACAINRLNLATLMLKAGGRKRRQAAKLLHGARPLPSAYMRIKRLARLVQCYWPMSQLMHKEDR